MVYLEPLNSRSPKINYSGQSHGSVMVPAVAKGFLIALCWKSFDYFASGMTATVLIAFTPSSRIIPEWVDLKTSRIFRRVIKIHFAVDATTFTSFLMAWSLNVCLSLKVCPCLSSTINYTVCHTRYRTRHFFSNSNTNEVISTKFEQQYVRCLRNEEECVCSPLQISLQYPH